MGLVHTLQKQKSEGLGPPALAALATGGRQSSTYGRVLVLGREPQEGPVDPIQSF